VVWTDLFQILITASVFLVIVVKGTLDIGGVGVLIERNQASGRLEAPKSVEFDALDGVVLHSINAQLFSRHYAEAQLLDTGRWWHFLLALVERCQSKVLCLRLKLV
jgi:Na+/proline symporter